MIRNYILTLATVVFCTTLSAQQDPQFTQWFMDPVASNIAAAGQSELTNVNGFYRNQWMNLDRAPVTSLFNIDGKLNFMPGAFGIQFYQDELGHESNTMAKLGYVYQFDPFSGGTQVSLGVSASYFSKRLGNDWIAIDNPFDDSAIPNSQTTSSTADIDLGLFISNPGKFYAGLSMTHLMQNELADMSITPTRHYYAMTGFNIPLSGDVLILRNNILAKTDFNAGAVDLNVNVIYDDMLWAGVSWRPQDAVAPVMGFQYRTIKKEPTSYSEQLFRIGYSYDLTTSELQTYSNGSHEVFLSYGFKFESTPILNRYSNPRFL